MRALLSSGGGLKASKRPSVRRVGSLLALGEKGLSGPRWRSLGARLALFAAGALLVCAFAEHERAPPSNLAVLNPHSGDNAGMSRRGLYTSDSGGAGEGWGLFNGGWSSRARHAIREAATRSSGGGGSSSSGGGTGGGDTAAGTRGAAGGAASAPTTPAAAPQQQQQQQQQPQQQQRGHQQPEAAAARAQLPVTPRHPQPQQQQHPRRHHPGAAPAAKRVHPSDAAPAEEPAGDIPNPTNDPMREGRVVAPKDFDWRGYLLRYPDLRTAGVRSKAGAHYHYTTKGHRERRAYARVPVLLRYTACQGLFNQMYAHLNALVLAEHLGADVVLPPSVYRESFAKYFTMTQIDKNEVKWLPADTGALLDVEALTKHYAKKGIKIHRTPPMEAFPDCMHPHDAFPRYRMEGVRPQQVVQLPGTYLASSHLWALWDRAAELVMEKHRELADAGWPANTTVVLDLPCPFLSIMTLTCLPAAQDAAAALKFNRTIVSMARAVARGMREAGVQRYNGAHLRLEKDAIDWARMLGGTDAYLRAYAKAFQGAGLSREKDLYIASGLLSYNASDEMRDMLGFLRPHSKSVQYKELYLPPGALSGLNPEQEALVDFLVLSGSANFVGLGSSTFSTYLREYRVLLGHRRAADVFVDTSKIGTDGLFERTTHFAPLDPAAAAVAQRARREHERRQRGGAGRQAERRAA